jgi:hypothetical protein
MKQGFVTWLRTEGKLIGRVPKSEKGHPSVLRHALNGDVYFSPTELGKFGDNLVKAAWTVSQLFNDGLFYRQPSVTPPIDEKCAETTTRPTREPAYLQ